MRNRNVNLISWMLFIVSAVSFTVSSIRNFWAMVDRLFFLVACIIFLITFLRNEKNER